MTFSQFQFFFFFFIYEILARYTSLSTGRGQYCRYYHGFVAGNCFFYFWKPFVNVKFSYAPVSCTLCDMGAGDTFSLLRALVFDSVKHTITISSICLLLVDKWKPCLWLISLSCTCLGMLYPQGPPCEEELVGEHSQSRWCIGFCSQWMV